MLVPLGCEPGATTAGKPRFSVPNGAAPIPATSAQARPLASPARTDCFAPLEAKHEWNAEVMRRVDAALPELGSCTQALSSTGELELTLWFKGDGSVQSVNAGGTNIDDCNAVACVKRGLAKLTVPPPPAFADALKMPVLRTALSLSAGVAPRRIQAPHFDQNQVSRCAPPRKPPPDDQTRGRLPPEVIQSVVRSNYATFRHCYEAGLGRDPTLRGLVEMRFTIDPAGKVSNVDFADVTLRDCDVIECMAKGFSTMSFPHPKGGIVTVVYPIKLEPG
jgi:hypothetical protein